MTIELRPRPLDAGAFAPYGDVIEARDRQRAPMNAARFDRFDALATVEVDAAGTPAIGIVRARVATALPYRLDVLERHPLGSQAFVPLGGFRFVVVVGPPGEAINGADLVAFVSDGSQGVNYHRGTWHMPLIALAEGQQFLVVDRAGDGPNCEIHQLDEAVVLVDGG